MPTDDHGDWTVSNALRVDEDVVSAFDRNNCIMVVTNQGRIFEVKLRDSTCRVEEIRMEWNNEL